MLQVGDKVEIPKDFLVSWTPWARDYFGSRVGTVIEAENSLGWCRVKWDKPRWDDPNHFEDTEASDWLVKIEGLFAENVDNLPKNVDNSPQNPEESVVDTLAKG